MFHVLHSEKIPSHINRYVDEARHVCSVLERCLQGKNWLVGDKITFADLAFGSLDDRLEVVLMVEKEHKFERLPKVKTGHERMSPRPLWKKAMDIQAKLLDEQGSMWYGMLQGSCNMEEYMEKMKQDE